MKTLSKVSGVGAEGNCLRHLLLPGHGNSWIAVIARSSFIISARFGEVTDSKGSRGCCFPEILNVPRNKAEENIEVM